MSNRKYYLLIWQIVMWPFLWVDKLSSVHYANWLHMVLFYFNYLYKSINCQFSGMSHDPWRPVYPFKINPSVDRFRFSWIRVWVIKTKPTGDPCISLILLKDPFLFLRLQLLKAFHHSIFQNFTVLHCIYLPLNLSELSYSIPACAPPYHEFISSKYTHFHLIQSCWFLSHLTTEPFSSPWLFSFHAFEQN